MKKQTMGIVAGVAGAALLLGGGTFALWSDSADAPGGTITSGNLDVAASAAKWYDVSADRADSPHAIDLKTFKIVPGDSIQGRFGVDVGLEGDNMVAELKLVNGGKVTDELAKGLDIKYSVQDATGKEIASGDNVGAKIKLVSSDNTNPAKDQVAAGKVTDGTADFNVAVTVTFKAATANRDLAAQKAVLDTSSIQLNQVR